MTDKHLEATSSQQTAARPDNVHQNLTEHDYKNVFSAGHQATATHSATDVAVSNPYSHHGGPLGDIVDSLQADTTALHQASKGSAAYLQAETQLQTDISTLHADVKTVEKSSANFADFKDTLQQYHDPLKSIANDLWSMGLKTEASGTTANFPLDHYAHEFKENGGWYGTGSSGSGGTGGGTGSGGDVPPAPAPGGGSGDVPPTPAPGGTPGLPGGQIDNNLQNAPWNKNTNASEIGGSGNVQGIDLSNANNSLDYTSNMGAYGDTLISNKQQIAPTDKNFQFNYQFDPSTNTFKNVQCLEADMVVTDANGQHAVIGSQFDLSQKTPAGMCWFQTWNTQTGHWENAAMVPIPKDGQFNDVSMSAKLNGNGTYTYTNLTYDGQSYALQNNTFGMVSSNWGRNETVLQLQEDANSHGGPVDVQYTNVNFQHS